jgi:hypothetical protein
MIVGMTLLAFVLSVHTGIRLAEVGEALGAAGGIVLLLGGMTPLGRRAGQFFGGLGIAAGFVCLLIATRWGHFH